MKQGFSRETSLITGKKWHHTGIGEAKYKWSFQNWKRLFFPTHDQDILALPRNLWSIQSKTQHQFRWVYMYIISLLCWAVILFSIFNFGHVQVYYQQNVMVKLVVDNGILFWSSKKPPRDLQFNGGSKRSLIVFKGVCNFVVFVLIFYFQFISGQKRRRGQG